MEMATADGRTRDSSSRADLSLSRNAWRADTADVWAYLGTGAREKQCQVTPGCLWIWINRKREWAPAPLAGKPPSGREDPRPPDRAWRAAGSVRWRA